MTIKQISPMELSTLLNKCKACIHNLSLSQFRVMTYLLSCANTKDGQGYKCWPSTITIAECTGLNTSTIEKVRPELVKAGWIQYVQGRGAGNSNTYYINGHKIIECYITSGNKMPDGVVASTVIEDKQKAKKEAKNRGNLKNQPKKQTPRQIPQDVIEYDPDMPDWAR